MEACLPQVDIEVSQAGRDWLEGNLTRNAGKGLGCNRTSLNGELPGLRTNNVSVSASKPYSKIKALGPWIRLFGVGVPVPWTIAEVWDLVFPTLTLLNFVLGATSILADLTIAPTLPGLLPNGGLDIVSNLALFCNFVFFWISSSNLPTGTFFSDQGKPADLGRHYRRAL